MNLSVPAIDDLSARVLAASAEHTRHFPGGAEGRQPVHTLYVPADRFTASAPADFGAQAARLLEAYAPDATAFGGVFGIHPALAPAVRERVAAKLATEPVEDVRIDFEDGFGLRSDAEEDAHVSRAVEAVAAAYLVRSVPPFWGLRVKSFAEGGHERAMRTLDGFLTGLRDRLGRLPGGFIVTFPKVVSAGHVEVFAEFCERLERALGLPSGALRFEIQVETTETIVDEHGRIGLRAMVEAGRGRVRGAHFGVYDYTTACDLPPAEQRLDHPACDFARSVMQAALAGTGVRLSDGGTNAVPRGDHPDEVHAVWRLHASLVSHALRHGFYQGWDTHPAHLPSRYAAVYTFHLAGIEEVIGRVRAWYGRGGAGGGHGPRPGAGPEGGSGVVDEPATIRSLTARLRRAVDCGAVDESVLPAG